MDETFSRFYAASAAILASNIMLTTASRRRPSKLDKVDSTTIEARVASVVEVLVTAADIEAQYFLVVSRIFSAAVLF